MAMFDWNQDGKKDMTDNFIEYQMYKKSTEKKNENSYSSRSGSGMSTFGAIVCVLSGLVGQAMLYTILDIDVENVPVVVIIILWIVISTGVAVVAEKIGL